tara:strand:- start:193 stop:675 length:483 start_codon:yes stop_codon:yes gene_type:complete
VKVIKNFLPEDLISFLHTYFWGLPHKWGHTSIPGSTNQIGTFYMIPLEFSDPLMAYLCTRVENVMGNKKVHFDRIYVNVQHPGMESNWHKDDGDLTALLMISPTLSPGTGCFEYSKDNENHSIEFEQNKFILFDGQMTHRGRAPQKGEGPRMTLAFKIFY